MVKQLVNNRFLL